MMVPPLNMRFCLPEVAGKGAGLGNELFPWAKAFIASRELDALLIHPPWGRNPRGYRDYFGTSRYDWVWQRVLFSLLPCYRLSREAYVETGKTEYGAAVRAFAARHRLHERRAYVLLTPGMWGGFHAVRQARHFILSVLYNACGAAGNLYELHQRLAERTLLTAVHIRRGDFLPHVEGSNVVGAFNVSIPLDWYISICRALRRRFGPRVSFLLLTDSGDDEVAPFVEEFHPATTVHQEMNVCSDILAMAGSDLLVCSVSSFSMWGAFLSSSPYLWYRPNLGGDDGMLSIWGHEEGQWPPEGVTARNAERIRREGLDPGSGRGVPVDRDGRLPAALLMRLEDRLCQKEACTDLLLYGVVRESLPAAPAVPPAGLQRPDDAAAAMERVGEL